VDIVVLVGVMLMLVDVGAMLVVAALPVVVAMLLMVPVVAMLIMVPVVAMLLVVVSMFVVVLLSAFVALMLVTFKYIKSDSIRDLVSKLKSTSSPGRSLNMFTSVNISASIISLPPFVNSKSNTEFKNVPMLLSLLFTVSAVVLSIRMVKGAAVVGEGTVSSPVALVASVVGFGVRSSTRQRRCQPGRFNLSGAGYLTVC
jgi:hypothetical protein